MMEKATQRTKFRMGKRGVSDRGFMGFPPLNSVDFRMFMGFAWVAGFGYASIFGDIRAVRIPK